MHNFNATTTLLAATFVPLRAQSSMQLRCAGSFLFVLALASCAQTTAVSTPLGSEVFVSPDGVGNGSAETPCSLDTAQSMVRFLIRDYATRNESTSFTIDVRIQSGTYYLSNAMVFDSRDSPPPRKLGSGSHSSTNGVGRVTWHGLGTATLTNGIPLSNVCEGGWSRGTDVFGQRVGMLYKGVQQHLQSAIAVNEMHADMGKSSDMPVQGHDWTFMGVVTSYEDCESRAVSYSPRHSGLLSDANVSGISWIAYDADDRGLTGACFGINDTTRHTMVTHSGAVSGERTAVWECVLSSESDTKSFDQLFVDDVKMPLARFPDFDPVCPFVDGNGYTSATGPLMSLDGHDVDGQSDSDNERDPTTDEAGDADETWPGSPELGVAYDPSLFSQRSWRQWTKKGSVEGQGAGNGDARIYVFPWGDDSWGNVAYTMRSISRGHFGAEGSIRFGEGGWQINTYQLPRLGTSVKKGARFYVEGIAAELDAPGEWIVVDVDSDRKDVRNGKIRQRKVLRYATTLDDDIRSRQFVFVPKGEPTLLQFDKGAYGIEFRGFRFTQTSMTFMDVYDAPSRGDWSIHRGGAIMMSHGAKRCAIRDCWFDQVGGNAVFIDGAADNIIVQGCRFSRIGDTAIAVVGRRERSLGTQRWYSRGVMILDNVMSALGQVGKQIAGVFISNAVRVTVAHNALIGLPRAGIVINDGLSGGHIISNNIIDEAVRETGDHGPFNAWGRERHWCAIWNHYSSAAPHTHSVGDVQQDAVLTTNLKDNLFIAGARTRAHYCIDLDDGASNYVVSGNVCVDGSVKLRDGDLRQVNGNMIIGSAIEIQMAHEDNTDSLRGNVLLGVPRDALYRMVFIKHKVGPGGASDYNCIEGSLEDTRVLWEGYDQGVGNVPSQTYMSVYQWAGLGNDQNSQWLAPGWALVDVDTLHMAATSPCLATATLSGVVDDHTALHPLFSFIRETGPKPPPVAERDSPIVPTPRWGPRLFNHNARRTGRDHVSPSAIEQQSRMYGSSAFGEVGMLLSLQPCASDAVAKGVVWVTASETSLITATLPAHAVAASFTQPGTQFCLDAIDGVVEGEARLVLTPCNITDSTKATRPSQLWVLRCGQLRLDDALRLRLDGSAPVSSARGFGHPTPSRSSLSSGWCALPCRDRHSRVCRGQRHHRGAPIEMSACSTEDGHVNSDDSCPQVCEDDGTDNTSNVNDNAPRSMHMSESILCQKPEWSLVGGRLLHTATGLCAAPLGLGSASRWW